MCRLLFNSLHRLFLNSVILLVVPVTYIRSKFLHNLKPLFLLSVPPVFFRPFDPELSLVVVTLF